MGPVSVFITRRNNTHDLVKRRTSEIASDCEKVIGLNQPDLKFRSDIAGSIDLAISMEHVRLAGDPEGDSPHGDTREVLPTVAPVTAQEHKDRAKSLSRKEREYKAFDLLVKCLAGAYAEAAGQHPAVTYNDSYEQGYGSFWHLMQIVLPVASEVAEADGIQFPQPPSESARAQKIKRILKERRKRLSR